MTNSASNTAPIAQPFVGMGVQYYPSATDVPGVVPWQPLPAIVNHVVAVAAAGPDYGVGLIVFLPSGQIITRSSVAHLLTYQAAIAANPQFSGAYWQYPQ